MFFILAMLFFCTAFLFTPTISEAFRKTVNLAVILFILLLKSSSALAIYEWIDPKTPPKIQKFLSDSINQEQPMAIEGEGEHRGIIFGQSWPQLDPMKVECLNDIQSLYRLQNRQRVRTIDIGSGPGAMTWKMIVAGGHVTAIELNKEVAKLILPNITTKAGPFLTEQERKNLPARQAVKNFLDISDETHADQYDIAWSGQNIHFFKPKDIPAYLKKMFKILKPGGRAYVTTITPVGRPDILETYLRARKENRDFPGYFACNRYVLGQEKKAFWTDAKVNQVTANWHLLPNDSDFSPGQQYQGFIGKSKIDLKVSHMIAGLTEYHEDLPLNGFRKVGSINLAFDEIDLKKIFTAAGFIVEKIYYFYIDNPDVIIPAHQFTDDMRLRNRFAIAIKAVKPKECADGKQ